MSRVLAVSSQVVFGPVGNTAAVPALQSQGHDVMQLPTVLLSHHPGHGKPVGEPTSAALFEKLLDSIAAAGALSTCDAVMTGYFASAAQVKITADCIRAIRPRHVLVDPVIGDHGRLYVPEDVANAIRDQLIPLATIATPNVFELGFLTQLPVTNHDEAIAAARKLGPPEVIVTSVPLPPAQIQTLLVTAERRFDSISRLRTQVPNGTGDFLAGLYLAHRLLHSAEAAFAKATSLLTRAIDLSKGTPVLAVAAALAAH